MGGSGITLDGNGGVDVLGLTGTGGNDTINAVETDATHFSYTLNAFTQPFVFAAVDSVQGVNIDACAGDDLIRISVSDSLQAAPVGSLQFNVVGGPSGSNDRLIVNDDGSTTGKGHLTLWRQEADQVSGSITVAS